MAAHSDSDGRGGQAWFQSDGAANERGWKRWVERHGALEQSQQRCGEGVGTAPDRRRTKRLKKLSEAYFVFTRAGTGRQSFPAEQLSADDSWRTASHVLYVYLATL